MQMYMLYVTLCIYVQGGLCTTNVKAQKAGSSFRARFSTKNATEKATG